VWRVAFEYCGENWVPISLSCRVEWSNCYWIMDWEVVEGVAHSLIWGISQEFVLSTWGKVRKTSSQNWRSGCQDFNMRPLEFKKTSTFMVSGSLLVTYFKNVVGVGVYCYHLQPIPSIRPRNLRGTHCNMDYGNWRIKKATRCHLIFYSTFYTLNMFRALLCPSSGARDHDVYHIGRVVLGLL